MPSVSTARNLGRVQGIDSSIGDLVLRDGQGLALALGGAVQPTPVLTRTIGGSSSIKMTLHDHELAFLEPALLAEKLEAQIDGLWFRYMEAELDPPALSITLEDRDVARLREFGGPVKAYRKGPKADSSSKAMTRAEFVVSLVKEALPRIPITCPQLHKVQPVATEKQAKSAKGKATEERGKGLSNDGAKHVKVKGIQATVSQIELGDKALRIAESLSAPYAAQVALIAALIDENNMSGPNCLQAEPFVAEGASTPAAKEISGFLTGKGWTGTGAIPYAKAHPDASPGEIATAVQNNRDGASVYERYVAEARVWVDEYEGGEGATATSTVTEPYIFEVHKDEDYWTAVKRLAKEVKWRAFFVAHRFFFIDEIELFRGMVRLAIDRETPGIEKVAFSFNQNRPATEVTVTAFANRWTPPPGSVVTVADYGPASVGFGDAPVKANSKGQRQGLSSNRKAATGEGRARYLVETIEAPLRDSDVSDLKLITVNLRKPTAPLPEPAPKTKTLSAAGGEGDASAAMGTLEGTPQDIVNQVIDYAHANGFPEVTRASVKAANAAHGPTVTGGTSDHQGPPSVRWAADISNGVSTPEEAHLAAAIASAFDIPYHGTLTTGELAEATHDGYRMQLIHNTMTGGDHFNHVHFGVAVASGGGVS